MSSPLSGVQALLFDVFGVTVLQRHLRKRKFEYLGHASQAGRIDRNGTVDWHGSVTKELERVGKQHGIEGDWKDFATTWRRGYLENTRRIAQGGKGPSSVDVMHREILEDILTSEKWKALSEKLTSQARDELNLVWHRLDGWPDSTPGLYNLKKEVIIATLSNGNVRLLVDMAKHADLPWDTIFSAELFESFKPDPKVYLGAVKHLSLEPQNCALVAAHVYDLRAAAEVGMRTVYIPRQGEDAGVGEVKSKAEGGDVDVVVQSFEELAKLLAIHHGRKSFGQM